MVKELFMADMDTCVLRPECCVTAGAGADDYENVTWLIMQYNKERLILYDMEK